MFCLILIGVFVKRTKMLTDEELVHTNRMVFRVFFFCMMFYNIYTTDLSATFRPGLMLFGGVGVIAVFLLATLFVCQCEPSNKRRGAMIQAIFRSNFVLMGIPLVSNIFGEDQLALPSMMIAIIVPIYNVVAVFVLISLLAAGVAAKDGGLINLGLITDHVGPKAKKVLHIISTIVCVIYSIILTYEGWGRIQADHTFSPILHISKTVFWSFVVIGGISMALHFIENCILFCVGDTGKEGESEK